MSNTRKAQPGAPFRQERFASSPEFERGLMANLVARRCELLESPADRALIWSLQLLSHREGGLGRVAQDLIAAFPERNATASMRKFGTKPGQVYSAAQVRAVREEIPCGDETFILRGELTGLEILSSPSADRNDEIEWRAGERPSNYPVEAFLNACRSAANGLPEEIACLCLDPGRALTEAGPWYFPDLVPSLREFRDAWAARQKSAGVFTSLGSKVCETLDYSLQGGCMTLIEGLARTGKTHAVKAWCELHSGEARYVQVPSTNDEIGFYRAIAKSLGVSINLNSKAQELRSRIEDAVQTSKLMLVFDEAHYLFPNSSYRDALPGRINWIMTALVNYGAPVALVATPQFITAQKRIENRSGWTSEQFIGRIAHYEKLPDCLSATDLESVAKALLPEGNADCIELLATYAQASAKYLAAIETCVRRARFLAGQDGRQAATIRDIRQAIKGSVVPSDEALKKALRAGTKPGRLTQSNPEPASGPAAPVPEFADRSSLRIGTNAPAANLVPALELSDSTAMTAARRDIGQAVLVK